MPKNKRKKMQKFQNHVIENEKHLLKVYMYTSISSIIRVLDGLGF
jgi:hypothetical protein